MKPCRFCNSTGKVLVKTYPYGFIKKPCKKCYGKGRVTL